MTSMIVAVTIAVVLAVLLCLSVIANIFSMYFVIRYGRMVLAWEENIGDALDMLDERYVSISRVLEKPLFRDTPEIRQMMLEIAEVRDAVLIIANALQLPATSKVIPETETARHTYGGGEDAWQLP